jgi:predicted HTH transcriptional regulator
MTEGINQNEDITLSHHHGDNESNEAHEKIKGTKTKWHNAVLTWLSNVQECRKLGMKWPPGATADEIASHFSVGLNTVAPRCTELKKAGKIKYLLQNNGKPLRRLTRSACHAKVYVLAGDDVSQT